MNSTIKMQGRYLNLRETSGGMEVTLTPDGRQELTDNLESHPEWTDVDHFLELFEDIRCNSDWEFVSPADEGIGLTGCQLAISPDLERDDHNEITKCDTIFWHERYQIELAHEALLESGKLWLLACRN